MLLLYYITRVGPLPDRVDCWTFVIHACQSNHGFRVLFELWFKLFMDSKQFNTAFLISYYTFSEFITPFAFKLHPIWTLLITILWVSINFMKITLNMNFIHEKPLANQNCKNAINFHILSIHDYKVRMLNYSVLYLRNTPYLGIRLITAGRMELTPVPCFADMCKMSFLLISNKDSIWLATLSGFAFFKSICKPK